MAVPQGSESPGTLGSEWLRLINNISSETINWKHSSTMNIAKNISTDNLGTPRPVKAYWIEYI
ncbi:MAG: hypothetical protein F7B60_02625 [Desulfurococcales archaeon]|nr:hypothetical protein [Desulfurococcales archaeon]